MNQISNQIEEYKPENIEILSKHNFPTIHYGRFEGNNYDHYYSISNDGTLIEFDISTKSVYSEAKLDRPSEDFLRKNNHIYKISNKETYKISKTCAFNSVVVMEANQVESIDFSKTKSYLSFGYEDGLICIWSVFSDLMANYKKEEDNVENKFEDSYEDIEEKKDNQADTIQTLNSIHSKIPFKSNITEATHKSERNDGKLNLKNDNLNSNKVKLSNKQNGFSIIKSTNHNEYVNIFNLELVLIGQTGRILCLNLLEDKKILVSVSEQRTIKFWDLTKGIPLYNLDVDIKITNCVYLPPFRVIHFISQEPYCMLFSVKDKSFSCYQTKFNDLNDFTNATVISDVIIEDPKKKKDKKSKIPPKPVKVTKKYILFGGNDCNISVFDQNLTYIKDIRVSKCTNIVKIYQYLNYFILVTYNYLVFCTINFEENKVTQLFTLLCCTDDPCNTYLEQERYLIICSQDCFVYRVDLKREIDLYIRRNTMISEDAESAIMNAAYLKSLNKKKRTKSAKGKAKSVAKKK